MIETQVVKRFTAVPAELLATLDKIETLSVLENLFDVCVDCASLEEFSAALEKAVKAAGA